jgi:hypothetical protein
MKTSNVASRESVFTVNTSAVRALAETTNE